MSKIKYCFVQDESSHWYLIPVTLRKKFMKLSESDQHDKLDLQFEKYLTGSGVGRFSFIDPKDDIK